MVNVELLHEPVIWFTEWPTFSEDSKSGLWRHGFGLCVEQVGDADGGRAGFSHGTIKISYRA